MNKPLASLSQRYEELHRRYRGTFWLKRVFTGKRFRQDYRNLLNDAGVSTDRFLAGLNAARGGFSTSDNDMRFLEMLVGRHSLNLFLALEALLRSDWSSAKTEWLPVSNSLLEYRHDFLEDMTGRDTCKAIILLLRSHVELIASERVKIYVRRHAWNTAPFGNACGWVACARRSVFSATSAVDILDTQELFADIDTHSFLSTFEKRANATENVKHAQAEVDKNYREINGDPPQPFKPPAIDCQIVHGYFAEDAEIYPKLRSLIDEIGTRAIFERYCRETP